MEEIMTMTLDQELKTYRDRLPTLLEHEGKFVVITGDQVVDILSAYEDALKKAYEICGVDKPFLVKQIEAVDQVCYFTRSINVPCLQ